MKKILRLTLILIGIFTVIGFVCFLQFYFTKKEYDEQVSKVVYVDIYQKEHIEGLKKIAFKICDSTYQYKLIEIKDTISNKLIISNKIFPCKVTMIYEFDNGEKKQFKITDYNCGGCSGTNLYILKENRIEYLYRP